MSPEILPTSHLHRKNDLLKCSSSNGHRFSSFAVNAFDASWRVRKNGRLFFNDTRLFSVRPAVRPTTPLDLFTGCTFSRVKQQHDGLRRLSPNNQILRRRLVVINAKGHPVVLPVLTIILQLSVPGKKIIFIINNNRLITVVCGYSVSFTYPSICVWYPTLFHVGCLLRNIILMSDGTYSQWLFCLVYR